MVPMRPGDLEQMTRQALEVALRRPRPGEHIHMMGVGGVGMAGLALLLKARGWMVSGCDASAGGLLPWLRSQGIDAAVGHDAGHLEKAPALIVRSPAVAWSEPELLAARGLGVPVIDRGRLLPELLRDRRTIAVAGTHGKTTTSSMIAWMLAANGLPVSFCIGGVCPGLGAVARVDREGWTVVEADESDGTLRHYTPDIAVVTSVDLDHVDFFQDEDRLLEVYRTLGRQSRRCIMPYGVDLGLPGERATSFGVEAEALFRASALQLTSAGSSFRLVAGNHDYGMVRLAAPGRHNILNALAALAAGSQAGWPMDDMVRALSSFSLPRRRFEQVAAGRGIRVLSDYAHHPVEIAALIDQARLSSPKRMIAVFQPHRYSRTRMFRDRFVDVLGSLDHVILAPVYAASEPFIEGGTSDGLLEAAGRRGYRHVELSSSVEDAWRRLQAVWRADDLVLIIGAGDVDRIGAWAAETLAT